MKTIVPLAFLALAFWLGAASADEQVRPSQIVLTDGTWTTTIEAGRIWMRGPGGASIRISTWSEETREGQDVRVSEPSVWIAGPNPKVGTAAGAMVNVFAHVDGCGLTMEGPGVHTYDPERIGGSRQILPFIGLGADELKTSLVFRERGKVVQELPGRRREKTK